MLFRRKAAVLKIMILHVFKHLKKIFTERDVCVVYLGQFVNQKMIFVQFVNWSARAVGYLVANVNYECV